MSLGSLPLSHREALKITIAYIYWSTKTEGRTKTRALQDSKLSQCYTERHSPNLNLEQLDSDDSALKRFTLEHLVWKWVMLIHVQGEEAIANHSIILAWRIPGQSSQEGPHSIRSQRVTRDWKYRHTRVCFWYAYYNKPGFLPAVWAVKWVSISLPTKCK